MAGRETHGLSEQERRRLGQHFIVGFPSLDVNDQITTMIRDYFVGSVIIFKRNIKDFEHVRGVVAKLQQIAKDAGHEQPLLIGIDQENGLASAFTTPNTLCGTQFPGAMALAASGDPAIAEQVSAASGRELHAAGINWVFSPVCDVNSDPQNPIIGVRSYGDDPHKAASFASAVARGFLASGVAPCGKHFPGHGDTAVDSHLALPTITRTRSELDACELVPFRTLDAAGILPSIMSGHIALPALVAQLMDQVANDELTEDEGTPASMSRAVSTVLLREQLQYQGLLVTDCLEMDAISQSPGPGVGAGAVKALQAGADIAMICHRLDRQLDALHKVYAAVASGSLVIPDASDTRVRAFKERFAHPPSIVDWVSLKRSNTDLSRAAYDKCIAMLQPKGDNAVLPINREQKVLLLTPAMQSTNPTIDDETDSVLRAADGALRNTAGPSFNALAKALSPATHAVLRPNAAFATGETDDVVVFVLRNARDHGSWQLKRLRETVQGLNGARLVLLSSCTPYDLKDAEEICASAGLVEGREFVRVATFEFTKQAFEAGVRVLRGEVVASARLPVRL